MLALPTSFTLQHILISFIVFTFRQNGFILISISVNNMRHIECLY